jgi:hypothetical protein
MTEFDCLPLCRDKYVPRLLVNIRDHIDEVATFGRVNDAPQ